MRDCLACPRIISRRPRLEGDGGTLLSFLIFRGGPAAPLVFSLSSIKRREAGSLTKNQVLRWFGNESTGARRRYESCFAE
jgi:hypothetical protein